jgi:oligopeptide/dipeptide ABC transporter ATP-binding protein
MTEELLQFENVTIQYSTQKGPLTAVSDASFTIGKSEFFGLVGESGCGKSTIAKSIMGALDDNGNVESGAIKYKNKEIQDYSQKEFNNNIRWQEISWIPQGAMNSLDPLERLIDQAYEIAKVHTDDPKQDTRDRLENLFEIMGLQPDRVTDYPHQFSGGMEQRAIIALALLLDPDLIIADEPTTALDVIMQDQIFNYLDKIQKETDTSLMLITHDISLVFETCQKLAIMHAGMVAETGEIKELYDNPRHPYSKLIQKAFPDHRNPNQELAMIDGHPPELIGDVDFCTFADRCPWAIEECTKDAPPLEAVGSDGGTDHMVSCIRQEEIKQAPDKAKNTGDT